MSHDSEIAEWGRARKAERQDKHREWNKANRATIVASGLPFTDRGETLLFRIDGKPGVDFYPSTGRWRVPGSKRTHSGGARGFLAWFAAQPPPKATPAVIHRHGHISRAALVEALSLGEPLGRVARRLGRHDRQSVLKLMAQHRVAREISGAGVVTITAAGR